MIGEPRKYGGPNINEGQDQQYNCEFGWCGGVLGIYALEDMYAHTELSIYYGEDYWIDGRPGGVMRVQAKDQQ